MEETPAHQDFSFRLHGNGVSPETFRAREVGKLITQLEHAFQYYLEAKDGATSKDFSLSLVSVKDASLGLGFISHKTKSFLAAFLAITGSINSGDYSIIPTRTIREFQEIQKLVRAKNCVADFLYQDEPFASIRPDTDISPSSTRIIGETVLYGEIKRVGGKSPTARVELDNGSIITCNVISQALAKQLGAKLYSNVALKGMASWSTYDNELLDFTIESLIHYAPPATNKEAFAGLSALLGHHWDAVDNIEAALLNNDTPLE
ncbi:hypothetical protein [Hymenobacter negativus]|uniref:Uncharacterized protein n=1 Tax=Hymenobacter negativus TaxID=2795026 RepID=A0ABS0Q372_9BACT|nr:hypothetical protein [Hymenobacter negativus]MBH8556721.1 hypothetical protein [Hymenobacter negativus]